MEASQKHALITGGTSGIGYGIALALLDAGYAVTVTGHTPDAIVAMPKRAGLNAIELDVTKDEDTANSVIGFDRLDALVNCAGIILREGKEFTVEGFQAVIDVNLTAAFFCSRERAPLRRPGPLRVEMNFSRLGLEKLARCLRSRRP